MTIKWHMVPGGGWPGPPFRRRIASSPPELQQGHAGVGGACLECPDLQGSHINPFLTLIWSIDTAQSRYSHL